MSQNEMIKELTNKGYKMNDEQREKLKKLGYAYAYNSFDHTALVMQSGEGFKIEYYSCFVSG